MTSLSLVVRPERAEDAPAVARLEARAFGPGRFARTAYRLREGNPYRLDLGVTASVGSFLVGSVRMSPVRAGEAGFLMLGPLAVDPSFEGRGIGTALTRSAIEAARVGFTPVPPGRLAMPGPVDPARLLWLELREGFAAALSGAILPAQG